MTFSMHIVKKDFTLKNKPMIQLFTGSGGIGSIVSSFLIKSLKMEEVAIIQTDAVPPVAIVKKGLIEHPIRILESEKMAIMVSEVPIPYEDLDEFVENLVSFYMKNEVDYIIPVGGIPSKNNHVDDPKILAVSYRKEMLELVQKKDIEILEEGVIYGSYVQTLAVCEKKGFKRAFSLLGECNPQEPAYKTSRKLVKALAKLLSFEFDEKLFDDIETRIEDKISESRQIIRQETFEKTRESHL